MMMTKPETEEERRRRRQIAFILRMKEQGQQKPPRKSTLKGDAELNKIREARRDARRND